MPDCNEEPYNIDTIYKFEHMTIYPNINYNLWLTCLNKKMFEKEDALNTNIIDTYKLIYNQNETSKEINNYSNYIYNNDLMYIYSKFLLFINLGILYFYFFKLTGITINGLIDTIKKNINEIPNIKKNIENKIK